MNTADMSPAVRAAFLHHTAEQVLEAYPPEARRIFSPIVDQISRFDWTAASAREFTAQLEQLCTELDADLPTYLWGVFGAFVRGGYPSSEIVGQIFAELDDDPREA